MTGGDDNELARYTTSQLAAAASYSVQQVRDLESQGVLAAASRKRNGYRQFTDDHVTTLRVYRRLAFAVGPVIARATLREFRTLPYDGGLAKFVALHVDLARMRDRALSALDALDSIVDESMLEAPAVPEDAMTITELSEALAVRSSTLRFWEAEGLIKPERLKNQGARRYPPQAVRDARVAAALRAGGYRIPAVREVLVSLHSLGDAVDARDALNARLSSIASRSEALLLAGTDLVTLLRRKAATSADE